MLEELYTADYWFSRFIIQRALGAIYLVAFINAFNQFCPLAGENGFLQAGRFLKQVSFKRFPGIFYWRYSDLFLKITVSIGIMLSVIALIGLSEMGPLWLSMIIWFLLWALYLSVVNIGQTFYGFGWESMLLEAGFYAIFLGPLGMAAPALVIWMIRWMLFRVEFGAGLIKMRGDPCWRNLTCLNYHHETQPLPNPLSRYFHHLPEPLHKVETFFNHFVQLVAIWGLFFPQPIASISAALIVLSQGYLIISGNYSWLNWLTLSLAFSGFSDGIFWQLFYLYPPEVAAMPVFYQGIIIILGLVVVWLSIKPVKNMLSRSQIMNFSYNPIHLVNTYGAFGSVTKTRYEIIIEGTDGNKVNSGTVWKAYEFKAKPGDPYRRSPQVSPYHLRLDWQMWFAAMSGPHHHPWLKRFLYKLLTDDKGTLKLLKHNPFPENPPKHIRARLFRYEFSTYKERKESGRWWNRTFADEYIRPFSLQDFN